MSHVPAFGLSALFRGIITARYYNKRIRRWHLSFRRTRVLSMFEWKASQQGSYSFSFRHIPSPPPPPHFPAHPTDYSWFIFICEWIYPVHNSFWLTFDTQLRCQSSWQFLLYILSWLESSFVILFGLYSFLPCSQNYSCHPFVYGRAPDKAEYNVYSGVYIVVSWMSASPSNDMTRETIPPHSITVEYYRRWRMLYSTWGLMERVEEGITHIICKGRAEGRETLSKGIYEKSVARTRVLSSLSEPLRLFLFLSPSLCLYRLQSLCTPGITLYR